MKAHRDPHKLNTSNLPLDAFDFLRKWFTLLCGLAALLTLFIFNAPFGRFSPSSKRHSAFLVNGIRSWIVMELVAPITFFTTYYKSPLSFYPVPLPALTSPQGILATLFLIHYANRALISPLRTPSRSKAHLIVPLAGIIFNLANGYMLGAYLSSPFARMYLTPAMTWGRTSWWVGLAMWGVGFVGNVLHDEVLLNLRRRAREREEKDADDGKGKANGEKKVAEKKAKGEYYGIPQGLFYTYISYPNYLFEWLEWTGFALAAAPVPIPIDYAQLASASLPAKFPIVFKALADGLLPLGKWETWNAVWELPNYMYAPMLTPPWIFVWGEVATMLPRALAGHRWYRERFGEAYPKGRKAIIPFIL